MLYWIKNLKHSCLPFEQRYKPLEYCWVTPSAYNTNNISIIISDKYGKKEGDVIFDNTLNTFYLDLCGVCHRYMTTQMVRKETCCYQFTVYYFWLTARDFLHAPSHRIVHTTAFVTTAVEHWLEWEIVQRAPWGIHPMAQHTLSGHSSMELGRTFVFDSNFTFLSGI